MELRRCFLVIAIMAFCAHAASSLLDLPPPLATFTTHSIHAKTATEDGGAPQMDDHSHAKGSNNSNLSPTLTLQGSGSPSPAALSSFTATGGPFKVFTFHRDEVELLADWAAYHGAIFGPGNIYIIDQVGIGE